MRTLVFSDTHLRLPFEEKKYNFLQGIIKNADQVIMNGDFWEGYFVTYKAFMDSPWKHLFPLLKEKNTVYLYGNHDRKHFSDSDVTLFSAKQLDSYTLQSGDKTFFFEHGNRLLPLENYDLEKFIVGKASWDTAVLENVEKLIVKTTGSRYQHLLKRLNNKIKKLRQPERVNGEYYVVGHTHCAEVDHVNRFINTGMIKHGLGQYMYITNGNIDPREERYD